MASGDLYEVAGAAGRGGAGRGAAEGSAGSRSRSPRSSEERRKSPREGLGWGERAGVCAGGGQGGMELLPPFPLPLFLFLSLDFPSGSILAGLAREKEEGVKESES